MLGEGYQLVIVARERKKMNADFNRKNIMSVRVKICIMCKEVNLPVMCEDTYVFVCVSP